MRNFNIYCVLCLTVFTMISCNREDVQDNVDWRVFPVEYIEPYFPFSISSIRTFVSDQGDTIRYSHYSSHQYTIWRERIFSKPDVFETNTDELYKRVLQYENKQFTINYNLNVYENRNLLDINFEFTYKNYHVEASRIFKNPTPENPNNIFSLLTDTIELYQSDVLCAKIVKYEGPVWFLTYTKDESDGTIIGQTEWRLAKANISLTDK